MVLPEVATGLLAGTVHVVTGPDHLAALAPIACRDTRQGSLLGAVWGAGHGTGVVILGLIATLFKEFIDIDFLSRWSEYFVGFILIAIGGWALRQGVRLRRWEERELFAQGEYEFDVVADACQPCGEEEDAAGLLGSVGARGRGKPSPPRGMLKEPPSSFFGAYGIGILHGAAGTGHLFGVLPSLALPPLGAAVYLFSYLASAIAAMAGFGALVGLLARSGPRVGIRMHHITCGCGVLAMAVGAFWIVSQS